MSQSKETNRSRKRHSEFERKIQLQAQEYEARYYPGGRNVAASLSAEKFPTDADTSSSLRPSNRES